MAIQQRPMLAGGHINDNRYLGNFFLLDRHHPNPVIAQIVNHVLVYVGGYRPGRAGAAAPAPTSTPPPANQADTWTPERFLANALSRVAGLKKDALRAAKSRVKAYCDEHAAKLGAGGDPAPRAGGVSVDDLPRFVCLAVEVKDDQALRETYWALYDAFGSLMMQNLPNLATGQQIKAHLTALGAPGGYAPPAAYIPPEDGPLHVPGESATQAVERLAAQAPDRLTDAEVVAAAQAQSMPDQVEAPAPKRTRGVHGKLKVVKSRSVKAKEAAAKVKQVRQAAPEAQEAQEAQPAPPAAPTPPPPPVDLTLGMPDGPPAMASGTRHAQAMELTGEAPTEPAGGLDYWTQGPPELKATPAGTVTGPTGTTRAEGGVEIPKGAGRPRKSRQVGQYKVEG